MGKFYIDVDQATAQVTRLRNHKSGLTARKSRLMEVHSDLWIGVETEAIREVLERLNSNLELEANQVEILATALEKIIALYVKAETDITNHINGGQATTPPSGNGNGTTPSDNSGDGSKPSKPEQGDNSGDEEDPDEPFNVYDWLAEESGLPKDVIETIALILSFIPVINCLTDIIDIINHVSEALGDDGKISWQEGAVIAWDIVNLGLDIASAGEIIKGATKAVKSVKAANTAAKHADDVAEAAAKTAAKKAAKSGGSVPATKAAKKATKALKRAEKAADKAKAAKEAAKQVTKETAKKAAKKAAKDTAGNAAKGVPRGKAKDYLIDKY